MGSREYVFKRSHLVKPLTQKKIAEIAGVSQPTVSRILSGGAGVDEDVRERVMEIVNQNGYQPHAMARGLRTHRSDTLCLAVRRGRKGFAKDPFYAELILAVMDTAAQNGYHLSVCSSRTAGGERLFYDALFRSNRVDGLIILESLEHDERIERLREHRFPFVLVGRYDNSPDLFTVNNDNVGGMRTLVRYLFERGRRKIGFINGLPDLTVCQDRLLGYRKGLEDVGLAYDPALVCEADFGEPGGRRAAQRMLKESPDAIIALDDIIGLGALAAVKQSGRRVPEDVALAGFNDSLFCPHTEPSLTSMRLNVQELGRQAAEMLIARTKDSTLAPRQVLIPCEIVERGST